MNERYIRKRNFYKKWYQALWASIGEQNSTSIVMCPKSEFSSSNETNGGLKEYEEGLDWACVLSHCANLLIPES